MTNQITMGMALEHRGEEDGRNGAKESIMLNDCLPVNAHNFEAFKQSSGKLEDRGNTPTIAHIYVKTAQQHARLYATVCGADH